MYILYIKLTTDTIIVVYTRTLGTTCDRIT